MPGSTKTNINASSHKAGQLSSQCTIMQDDTVSNALPPLGLQSSDGSDKPRNTAKPSKKIVHKIEGYSRRVPPPKSDQEQARRAAHLAELRSHFKEVLWQMLLLFKKNVFKEAMQTSLNTFFFASLNLMVTILLQSSMNLEIRELHNLEESLPCNAKPWQAKPHRAIISPSFHGAEGKQSFEKTGHCFCYFTGGRI